MGKPRPEFGYASNRVIVPVCIYEDISIEKIQQYRGLYIALPASTNA